MVYRFGFLFKATGSARGVSSRKATALFLELVVMYGFPFFSRIVSLAKYFVRGAT